MKTFKGFDLDKNGCIEGAYPSFSIYSELQKATETMIEKENEYVLRLFTSMNIDPDVLAKQKAEIERLSIENEQLKQQIETKRKKLFDILTEYEIGNYDVNIHQFYQDVYDVHNELMELAE